jgi:adenosylhomocysteine nucleosidase
LRTDWIAEKKHGHDSASIEWPAQARDRKNKNGNGRLILLFYAFAREIAPFKRRVRNRAPLALDGLHGFRAEIGGKSFAVVGHGIGHKRATDAASRAFDLIPAPELVIGTGVVGALSSGLKPGDLVLSDRVLAILGDGQVAEQVTAVGDAHLRAVARSLALAGIAHSTGAILTSNRVLATGVEKRRAKESTGAIAVDMETAAIAAEANVRGLPFLALRAVLDEVDDEVVGGAMADEDGNVRPLAATSYLLRNPATVLKLPRMIRNLSRATAAIADALTAIAHEGKIPAATKRARDPVAKKRLR